MSDRSLPPLSVDETVRILGRLGDLGGAEPVVLIGGTALAIWHAELSTDPPEPQLATTDVDLQGGPDAVRQAARLLDGKHRISRFDDHTTQAGAVLFLDSAGDERVLDFLSHPYGLDSAGVLERAIPIDIDVDDSPVVRIAVMNPIDCLRSRIANSDLPGREPEHAEAQLRAAIRLVPAYGRLLLDQGADTRAVMALNEHVYDLALDDRRAKKLYLEQGIDVANAELDDPRLPEPHRAIRLPQLRLKLQSARERPGIGR
jgi:hypothetical protein